MAKKNSRFLEYLLSKYEDKFTDDVLDFANHHFSLLKEHLNDDRKFISEIELSDLNPMTVYIDPGDGDAIEFDVVFNPTFSCYCKHGRYHDYETDEVSDIWLTISGKGTLSKKLTDIRFGWCKQYDSSKPKKPLEGNCIPVIYRHQYDDRASEILNKYYPEWTNSSNPIDVELLAKRMGITVMRHSISADGKSFGRVVFDDAECELYDAESGQNIKKKVLRNTIILDTNATSIFSLGSEKITLAHEIVHLYLHKSAFLFAKIIEKDLSQLECKNGGLIGDDDDPMKWFEIHANGIAPCIAMPKDNFIAKYKEYEDIYTASKGSYLDALESIIKALSDYFGVTRYSVKKRLLDLGIESAQGAFNFADGHYVRPYLFKKGTLNNDETFTISFSDFTNLMSEIKNVAYFYKGEFVFVENHLCINSVKYIEKDAFGNDALTHYARTHIDECCVKFKCSSLNEFVAKSTFNSFCYLCRDVAQDIQTIIDFSADNQILLKDPKLAEKVKHQNDAENEIKKKIAGSDLTETLNALKEIFQWKDLAMALDIGVDVKTVERYLQGKVKHPTIGVIIAMCLAMKLTPDLTSEVIKNAGLSIQSNSVRDNALRTIIITCRGKTVQEINEILIGIGVEPLT